MSEHKKLLKHRYIVRRGITENGGVIIVFNDESHTYISPKEFTDILLRINEILAKKSE